MKRFRTLVRSEFLRTPRGSRGRGRRRHRPGPKPKPRPVYAPVPRPFDFGFTSHRPLVPLAAVRLFLNKSTRQVLTLIEDGRLRWAFDIGKGGVERHEVRVFRQSLFEFAGLYAPSTCVAGEEEAEFAGVIEKILPPGTVVTPTVMGGTGLRRRVQETRRFQIQLRLPGAEFRQLLFPREPVLRGTDVAQCFSCLSQHVINLLREKSLTAVNLRRGPKASPLILRSSVVEFLKQRRMS